MLYQLREGQRSLVQPLSDWAASMFKLYGNPHGVMAYVPFSSNIAAGFELLHRLGKEYGKPPFDLPQTVIDGHEVPVTEKVVVDKPFCKLIRFERHLPAALAQHADDPVVLIVAPLSGHHSTLLRDTVRAMLPDNQVYITDWVDARNVPVSEGPFHLHDYIAYVIEFIRHLGPYVHLVSVCQPTVPVMAAVSIMATLDDPKQPLSMTMMGGPIDTRKSPTEVNNLATDHNFEWFEMNVIHSVPRKYPGAGRRVYPGFLQHAGFVAMNPDRHVNSHWDFYKNLIRGDLDDADAHRKFYDEYNAVLDLPAEYYLDTIRIVFQEFHLPRGIWDVQFEGRKIRVNPADIRRTALFTIEGQLDDISGIGQTRAAHELCKNIPAAHHRHLEAHGAGHYGIFSGRRWREIIYPQVRDFIAKHRERIAA
ncbi:MAG: polyhydroxyalkanoate depolymerase [Burkholderiaceae bacterium]